jgi:L-ribulose-5-phosphate 4-epimerase
MGKFDALKEKCYLSNMRLPELGLVLYTFGNVSAADQEAGVFAIKPSGIPYDELKAEDMVVLDFDNNIIDGRFRPSSDTKTHALLYKNWKDIQGISHTHSTYAVAWAQAQRDIPILGTTHADHLSINIPCAPVMSDQMIEGDYEMETGTQILNLFKARHLKYNEVEMVLLANHGPFTWGNTPEKAVYNSAVLEELAKMAYLTLQINSEAPPLKSALIKKHYKRKHGKDAYYGQK